MTTLCHSSWRIQLRPDRNAVLVATGLLLLLLVQGTTGFVQGWTGLSTTTFKATGSAPLAQSVAPRRMMMNEDDDFASRQQLPGDVQSSYTSSRRKYLMQLASVAMVPQLVLPAGAMICYPDDEEPATTPEGKKEQAEKVKLEQDEKVLIKEIEKEAKDEVKAEKDTDKLIKDLKKQADVTPPKPQAKEVKTTLQGQKNQLAQAQELIDLETKDLIDQLEQEEEQIEEETLQLMRKVETLEATAERLNKPLLPEPDAPNADEAVQKSQKETNEFLDKLKKRSQDKQDFINLLKQESSAYSSGSNKDKKLPEFLSSLRKTNEDDKEFGVVLNSFREKLQSRFQK